MIEPIRNIISIEISAGGIFSDFTTKKMVLSSETGEEIILKINEIIEKLNAAERNADNG